MSGTLGSAILFLAAGAILVTLSFPRVRELSVGRLQRASYLPKIKQLKKSDRKTLDMLGQNGSILGAGIISLIIGFILLFNPYG